MSAAGPLRREQDGALAVLRMDSPPLNLFDRAMIDAWSEAVEGLHDDVPRGLLIEAAGPVVSGGVDVHLFQDFDRAKAAAAFRQLLAITNAIETLPCPTVFAAHALTLTAAFEISLACDLLVASESARFGLVEAVVGITPAMGGTQRLVERAGPMRAREIVMTAELFSADTLREWNVVSRVYADDELAATARALASGLAEGPTLAHAVTKRIVRNALEGGTAQADRMTPNAVGELYETEDVDKAVRSFLSDGPGRATFEGK